LLDLMFAAIVLSRSSDFDEQSFYVTNVLPWRPPQNRDPKPDEIAMLWPFLEKHIQLISPDIVVAMGNISCQALLGERGITRLRGKIQNRHGVDILPMFHPAFLLRNPSAKREAWADLLKLKTKLDAT
ncbi:MAG: uracil-DNA glycosylase, partial [Paracoccaceae bacterium]